MLANMIRLKVFTNITPISILLIESDESPPYMFLIDFKRGNF